MAAYKDEERGTWYVSFHYNDWTGKNKRKLKRGFKTRKEAMEWEQKRLWQEYEEWKRRYRCKVGIEMAYFTVVRV